MDQSLMPHRSQPSTNPVWESMVVTAESDGGEVFIDNDGKLAYLDRDSMVVGRTDHAQPTVILSDTCSPGTISFSERAASDSLIRNQVVLTNVDSLQAAALDQDSIDVKGRRLLNLQAQTSAATSRPEPGRGTVAAQRAAHLLPRPDRAGPLSGRHAAAAAPGRRDPLRPGTSPAVCASTPTCGSPAVVDYGPGS